MNALTTPSTIADKLREAVNWQVKLPDYVFKQSELRGFFVVDSGVLSTRGFLDFMLRASPESVDKTLAVVVQTDAQSPEFLTFLATSPGEIRNIRIGLMQSPLDLFCSTTAVSSAPSKWIAYEEAREDFSIVAIFDDELWRRWSPQDSEIREYVICEQQLAASLISDEPPMWEPDFLRVILKSYGRGGVG